MSLANYMLVGSHVHKRTYTRTLRIHCPPRPVASKPGRWEGDRPGDRDLGSG
jgi:hypothetical protein